jgi:hypothetical protein
MTSLPSSINHRHIFYIDIYENFEEYLTVDVKNWVLFIIEDNPHNPYLLPFAEWCIDKDVLYVCAAGKACSEVDDLFDLAIVTREMDGRQLPSWMNTPEDVLMTTWHHDLEEGFWYATSFATYEEMPIDMVLIANMTQTNYVPIIEELTVRINNGWLPPD